MERAVLDTNVLVSALLSRRGASFRLLRLVARGEFTLSVSVPLVLEYEHASRAVARKAGLTFAEIDDVLDYICRESEHGEIFYLWRPVLGDPPDDMVLEVAVESEARFIVTHNIRHFERAVEFGIRAVTPRNFLVEIGELS